MTTARLMLAGGNGRLVRRPSVVMFDPTGRNQDVAARFDEAASDTDAVEGVKKHLVDCGFTAAPMVLVSWDRQDLDLVIFGDVAIHTSAKAAPMVTGAGSASWVERHIGHLERGSGATIELWSGDAAEPTTNLGLGVVACAGFRLSLEFAETPMDDQGDVAVARDESALPVADDGGGAVAAGAAAAAGAVSAAGLPIADVASPADPPSSQDAAALAEPIVDEPDLADVGDDDDLLVEPFLDDVVLGDASSTEADADVFAEPDADQSAAFFDVPQPRSDSVDHFASSGSDLVFDDEPAADPLLMQPDEYGEAPTTNKDGDPLRSAVGLIEAAMCERGHANPPQRAECAVCSIDLGTDSSLSLIEQPAVGQIVFPNGQSVPVDRDMQLGRKPVVDGDIHPVIIDHAEVSRSHASMRVEAWSALLTDLGSRNGTWVTPPNETAAVRLEAEVAHVLEHGTLVYLGSSDVQFTYMFETKDL